MQRAIQEWFSSHLPAHWGVRGVEVSADQDEILAVLDMGDQPLGAPDVRLFRERTRDERMALAAVAEERFRCKVSWGVRAGELAATFTTYSVPVMTRLRMPERQVLDTLIDAGVARSRSDALAWCVRLVGENESEWIGALRSAFEAVARERQRGPRSRRIAPDDH